MLSNLLRNDVLRAVIHFCVAYIVLFALGGICMMVFSAAILQGFQDGLSAAAGFEHMRIYGQALQFMLIAGAYGLVFFSIPPKPLMHVIKVALIIAVIVPSCVMWFLEPKLLQDWFTIAFNTLSCAAIAYGLAHATWCVKLRWDACNGKAKRSFDGTVKILLKRIGFVVLVFIGLVILESCALNAFYSFKLETYNIGVAELVSDTMGGF